MFTLPKTWDKWLKTMLASAVSGFANSVLAVMGTAGAASIGVPIRALDWKEALAVGASGAFISMMTFLKTQPVPPDSGNTTLITKPPTQNP